MEQVPEVSDSQVPNQSHTTKRSTFDTLSRNFRNLDNIHRYGVNNSKIHRRVGKKAANRDLYVVLNLDRNKDVLSPSRSDDEGQTQKQE